MNDSFAHQVLAPAIVPIRKPRRLLRVDAVALRCKRYVCEARKRSDIGILSIPSRYSAATTRTNLAATFRKFLHSHYLSEKKTNHGRRVTFPRPRIKQRPEKDFRH
jgi:hypothetical protein